MLPKINRLIRADDFEKVKKEGNLVRGSFFLLSFLRNSLSFSRFGIVVSKNVSKKATERNRIKRMIRETIRQIMPSIREGFDFVIIARKSIVGGKERLSKELEFLFEKIAKDEKSGDISN